MNCQHCGAELTNKRAKNCTECSAILAEANRYGTYGFLMEAIPQAKADGITGKDMHEAMRSATRYGATKRAEWMNEYRARQAEKQAATSARIAYYREHGRWPEQEGPDEEELDEMERIATQKPRPLTAEDLNALANWAAKLP